MQIELNAYKQECARLRDRVLPQRDQRERAQRERARSASKEFAQDATVDSIDMGKHKVVANNLSTEI